MSNNFLIYKFTSPSGKAYIGQTNNLHRRIIVHKNTDGCRRFALAIKKYGMDSFDLEILADRLSHEDANRLELELIAQHRTLSPDGYNLRAGGDSPSFSEETRAKLSAAGKRRKVSVEQKARLSELGHSMTQERMDKLQEGARKARERIKGNTHFNLGRKHGESHKKKTSIASKERWQDPSYRAKVIASRTGKKRSEETKAKQAESARAVWDRRRKEKEAAQGDLFGVVATD